MGWVWFPPEKIRWSSNCLYLRMWPYWKQCYWRCNSLRWGRTEEGWPLIQYSWCPSKNMATWGQKDTQGEGHMKGRLSLKLWSGKPRNIKDCWQPIRNQEEARNGSLQVSEGAWPWPWFWLLASRTKAVRFYCFKPPNLWEFVMAALRK